MALFIFVYLDDLWICLVPCFFSVFGVNRISHWIPCSCLAPDLVP